MNTKAKYKICKRLGSAVFEKCQTQKFTLSEARTSKNRGRGRRPRALSDYGRQLLEKQKVRYTYGISEKQLSRYIKSATKSKVRDVTPVTLLLEELESRLDNTVYRTGLAKTRALARQMVSHGHITVNGRKVTVPSFKVTPKDVLGIREGSKSRQLFVDLPEKLKDHQSPSWLTFDPKKMTGEVVSKPAVAMTELTFEPGVVIEYYSR